MRAMVSTACTGNRPEAVSAESMTASVPSRIALATSEASARVGRGLSIMLSSIWVAVMTTRPAPLATGHHQPVRRLQDGGEVVHGLPLLDLGDEGCRPAQRLDEGLGLLHVGGLPHEREGHIVHAVLDAEGQVAPVLLRQGRRR